MRLTKTIRTTEDWYPTVDGQVRVRCERFDPPNMGARWLVCVWCGDDFGYQRFYTDDSPLPLLVYALIQDGTTQRQLDEWGLQRV